MEPLFSLLRGTTRQGGVTERVCPSQSSQGKTPPRSHKSDSQGDFNTGASYMHQFLKLVCMHLVCHSSFSKI